MALGELKITRTPFSPADEGRGGGLGVLTGRGDSQVRGVGGGGCRGGSRELVPLGGARGPRRRKQRQRREDLCLLWLDDHDPALDLDPDGALHLPLHPRRRPCVQEAEEEIRRHLLYVSSVLTPTDLNSSHYSYLQLLRSYSCTHILV